MPNYTQAHIDHAKQWHKKAFDAADEQVVRNYHQQALKYIMEMKQSQSLKEVKEVKQGE